MRVLNPTGYEREVFSAGIPFKFAPFSIREIPNDYDGDHIVNRAGKHLGLVTLEPTKGERDKYASNPKGFFLLQTQKGLQELKKTIEQALIDERNAAMDVRNKKMEPNNNLINPKRFEEMLKEINAWIAETNAKEWSPARYLKNQARNEVEPFDYTNKGTSEAGRNVA